MKYYFFFTSFCIFFNLLGCTSPSSHSQNQVRNLSSETQDFAEFKKCNSQQKEELEKLITSQKDEAVRYTLNGKNNELFGVYLVYSENKFYLKMCDTLSKPNFGPLGREECPNEFRKWTPYQQIQTNNPNINKTVVPENFSTNDSYYFKSNAESDGFINILSHNKSTGLIAEIQGYCGSQNVKKKTVVRFNKR